MIEFLFQNHLLLLQNIICFCYKRHQTCNILRKVGKYIQLKNSLVAGRSGSCHAWNDCFLTFKIDWVVAGKLLCQSLVTQPTLLQRKVWILEQMHSQQIIKLLRSNYWETWQMSIWSFSDTCLALKIVSSFAWSQDLLRYCKLFFSRQHCSFFTLATPSTSFEFFAIMLLLCLYETCLQWWG